MLARAQVFAEMQMQGTHLDATLATTRLDWGLLANFCVLLVYNQQYAHPD